MKCLKCGAELLDDAKFCFNCGTKVENNKLFCRECGARLKDNAKYCEECGAKVDVDDIEEKKNNDNISKTYDGIEIDGNELVSEDNIHNTKMIKSEKLSLTAEQIDEENKDSNDNNTKYNETEAFENNFEGLYQGMNKIKGKVTKSFDDISKIEGKNPNFKKWIIEGIIFIISMVSYYLVFNPCLAIGQVLFGFAVTLLCIVLVAIITQFKNKRDGLDSNANSNVIGCYNKIEKYMLKRKIVIIIAACIVIIGTLLSGGIFAYVKNNPKVALPVSSKEAKQQQYTVIADKFRSAGFEKIQYKDIDVDSSEELKKSGQIIDVSVNGENDFTKNDKYRVNAIVSIKYYTDKKTSSGLESKEFEGKEFSEVKSELEKQGFSDIQYDEINEINNIADKGKVIKVTIAGKNTFKKSDIFDKSDVVIISYYSAKNEVKIKVACNENLILNKYDVDVYVDNNELEYIEHGHEGSYTLELETGKHTIRFVDRKDSSIDGKTEFSVDSDSKFKYIITCRTEQIDVENIKYLKVPITSDEAEEYDYNALKTLFENCGFKNVSVKATNDLNVDKIVDENKVASVKIGKKESFNKNDDVLENAKIVISYHSPIEVELPEYYNCNYNDYINKLKELGFADIQTDTNTVSDASDDSVVNKVKTTEKTVYAGDKMPITTKLIVVYNIAEQTQNNDENSQGNISASNGLSDSTALYTLSEYVKKDYPLKIKVHYITGCLNCEKQSDGTYFIKCMGTVKNQYGKKTDCTIEGYVGGNDDSPYVISYEVY